jgi:signal transduction histidine kinase/CheY-like chemotaxis protein
MLDKLSIEWKLPLAICGLRAAVVAGLAALAYREVAGSTQRAATERVENFAGHLAATFHATVDKGLVRLGAKASREPLIARLCAPSSAAADEKARAALEGLLVLPESAVEFAAVQLFDLERRCLLAVGPDHERIAALAGGELLPASTAATGGVGPLVALGERVVVPAFVPVESGDEILGWVARWAYVTLEAATRERVIGFLAPEAAAYLGTPGGLWIDWERVVPEPPLTASGEVVRVERAAGVQLAAAASVVGTPWTVVVEYPEQLVLAPARRLLGRIALAAALVLLAGLGGVWLVARRITGPLHELTLASESLVGEARAQPGAIGSGAGVDELGRLRTSFHAMSERVQEAHRRLEAKVGELRAAQQREQLARAEAEEANARKDEFLAMLAHELRNPLSPILCALAVVRSERAPDAARAEALAAIERQVRNMTRIVDDLLDVSRITRGKIELKARVHDARALVRNALETARPLVAAKQHRLECTLPETPLAIAADATRVEQVLANLVTNAAKYTELGGHIRVSAAREADEIVFRVRDDGIGIPADRLGSVFDLFHQVDDSIDRSRGGLGIGLTLVRKVVELHGGSVTASSPGPGQGSEFVVRLPACADGAVDAGTAPAAHAPRQASESLRILVVEDARDTRDLLELVLELDGHEVVTAVDGDEGLARFHSFDPEVVVLDIGLPGMNGFDVARRIRAERGEDVLLIAATGYGDALTRTRAHQVGFDGHLVKPIAHAELSAMIASRRPGRPRVAAGGG